MILHFSKIISLDHNKRYEKNEESIRIKISRTTWCVTKVVVLKIQVQKWVDKIK